MANKRPRWQRSDQPYGSRFISRGNCGLRVKPDRESGAFEWSIWIGPPGRRVLHDRGVAKTLASAKRTAIAKLANRYPYALDNV